MDDVIIYGTSFQKHMNNSKKVFQRLPKTNFRTQLDNSEFVKKKAAFLKQIVNSAGVKPNPEKMKATMNYRLPKTTRKIIAFLYLLGYYRKFIRIFVRIS